MNTGKVIALAAGAAVLVALAYYTAREEEQVVRSAAAPTAVVLKGVTSGTVERIEIRAPEDPAPVVLTRKDGVWYTDPEREFRADKNLVNGVFVALEQDIEGDVVSTNEESYADFLVDEKGGTRVKLLGAGDAPVADLIVGKDAGGAYSTYVRKPDAREVVRAGKALSYVFKKPEGWRDKTLLEFGSDTITRIAAEGSSATWTLAKEGGEWKVTAPEQRDAQMGQVSPLLSVVGNLRAASFQEVETTGALAGMGLDPPRQKLTISHEDRSTSPARELTTVLLIGNPNGDGPGNQYYVQRAGQKDVALIHEHQARSLVPEYSQLAVIPAPPPASADETTSPAASAEDSPTTAESAGGAAVAGKPAAGELITTGTTTAQSPPSPSPTPVPAVEERTTTAPEAKTPVPPPAPATSDSGATTASQSADANTTTSRI